MSIYIGMSCGSAIQYRYIDYIPILRSAVSGLSGPASGNEYHTLTLRRRRGCPVLTGVREGRGR